MLRDFGALIDQSDIMSVVLVYDMYVEIRFQQNVHVISHNLYRRRCHLVNFCLHIKGGIASRIQIHLLLLSIWTAM